MLMGGSEEQPHPACSGVPSGGLRRSMSLLAIEEERKEKGDPVTFFKL
jgi:hypothetical protein